MKHTDTIVAPITAAGGAVGVVRLSGPYAWSIASLVFSGFPDPPESHRAIHGVASTGDEGLALPFEPGRGYTGEQAVEISVHGSPASLRLLVEACLERGARLAEPGEFTLRAFMNGRLDLTEAEAVRDTVAAQTETQLRHANSQRGGAVSLILEQVVDQATALLARVEASVDFSEEIGDLDSGAALRVVREMRTRLDDLLETERAGRILRQGLKIAIVGEPNVGKSSLMNALLGTNRAIVTEIPGTTRDTVEASIELGGIPCTLIDTAGLRESSDPIEREGIARTQRAIESADVVWNVLDATRLSPPAMSADAVIVNKCDLIEGLVPEGFVRVSALQRTGLEQLDRWVEAYAEVGRWKAVIDPRHGPHLRAAIAALDQAEQCLVHSLPDDLLSTCLSATIHQLGQVTGAVADGDMLSRIFSDFCIGK